MPLRVGISFRQAGVRAGTRMFPLLLLFFTLSAASAQSISFEKSVYPILVAADCRACHNSEGVASGTRLQFPELDASPERIEAFGRSLVALVDRNEIDRSVILQKPTNRMTHAGG